MANKTFSKIFAFVFALTLIATSAVVANADSVSGMVSGGIPSAFSSGAQRAVNHSNAPEARSMETAVSRHTNGGRIVIFGGGEPLIVNGRIIGALGVSGGTAEQDTALAAYGASLLKEVISCL